MKGFLPLHKAFTGWAVLFSCLFCPRIYQPIKLLDKQRLTLPKCQISIHFNRNCVCKSHRQLWKSQPWTHKTHPHLTSESFTVLQPAIKYWSEKWVKIPDTVTFTIYSSPVQSPTSLISSLSLLSLKKETGHGMELFVSFIDFTDFGWVMKVTDIFGGKNTLQ